MKIILKELKPNPFKKMINKGNLNETQIKEISGNLDELGLMGAIPIVKIKDNYHLVNSHHRVESLKRKYGEDYKVEVTIHNYNDDQLLRGMVIENLAQRGTDFKEEIENIRTVEQYLNKNNDKLKALRGPRNAFKSKFANKNRFNEATATDVKEWLKLSEEKWSHDTINNIMNIYKKLDSKLLEKVDYVRGGSKENEDQLSFEDARNISRIEGKQEQHKIRKILDETNLDHKGKSKLITAYNNSGEEIKKKVLSKQIDIVDIDYEIDKSKHLKDVGYLVQKQSISDWILEISDKIKEAGRIMDISKINGCNKTQLDLLYRYIKVDFDKYYKPFLNSLIKNMQNKNIREIK